MGAKGRNAKEKRFLTRGNCDVFTARKHSERKSNIRLGRLYEKINKTYSL